MDINITERKTKPRVRWNRVLNLYQARLDGHIGQGHTIDKATTSLASAIKAAKDIRDYKIMRGKRESAR